MSVEVMNRLMNGLCTNSERVQEKGKGKGTFPPTTPYKEKGRGKERQTGSLKDSLLARPRARTRVRVGAWRIKTFDGETGLSYFERRLDWARGQIEDHKSLRRSAEVFELIVPNGENRKESICQLMLKRPRNGKQPRCCISDTSKNC